MSRTTTAIVDDGIKWRSSNKLEHVGKSHLVFISVNYRQCCVRILAIHTYDAVIFPILSKVRRDEKCMIVVSIGLIMMKGNLRTGRIVIDSELNHALAMRTYL